MNTANTCSLTVIHIATITNSAKQLLLSSICSKSMPADLRNSAQSAGRLTRGLLLRLLGGRGQGGGQGSFLHLPQQDRQGLGQQPPLRMGTVMQLLCTWQVRQQQAGVSGTPGIQPDQMLI